MSDYDSTILVRTTPDIHTVQTRTTASVQLELDLSPHYQEQRSNAKIIKHQIDLYQEIHTKKEVVYKTIIFGCFSKEILNRKRNECFTISYTSNKRTYMSGKAI